MSLDDEMDYEKLARHYANGESDGEPPELSDTIETLAAALSAERRYRPVQQDDGCLAAFVRSFVGPALLTREWEPDEVFKLYRRFREVAAEDVPNGL